MTNISKMKTIIYQRFIVKCANCGSCKSSCAKVYRIKKEKILMSEMVLPDFCPTCGAVFDWIGNDKCFFEVSVTAPLLTTNVEPIAGKFRSDQVEERLKQFSESQKKALKILNKFSVKKKDEYPGR